MTDSIIGEILAKYGIGAVLLIIAWRVIRAGAQAGFDALVKFGNSLVAELAEITKAVKDNSIDSANRAERHSTEIAGVNERLARIEARRDEREGWSEATPVHDIDDPRTGKRRKP